MAACSYEESESPLNQLDGSICHLGDTQIVSNHDYSEVLLRVQAAQQVQDLTSRAVVEVSGGFVGQQDLGVANEGPGDGGTLHLPPRQLARSMAETVTEANQVEQVLGFLEDFASVPEVSPDAVADHQRREHILKRRQFG
jgi:hypothetical protein